MFTEYTVLGNTLRLLLSNYISIIFDVGVKKSFHFHYKSKEDISDGKKISTENMHGGNHIYVLMKML